MQNKEIKKDLNYQYRFKNEESIINLQKVDEVRNFGRSTFDSMGIK